MGLLTDPTTEENTKKTFIVKYYGRLCFLMLCGSITWLGFLAHDNFSAGEILNDKNILQNTYCIILFFIFFSFIGTYFSENALLPGLVDGEYSEESEAQAFLTEIQTEANRFPYSIPDEWLSYKFRQLFLEAYIHNFTLNNPLKTNVVCF